MTVIGETPGEEIIDTLSTVIDESVNWRTNLVVINGVGVATGDSASAEYISVNAPMVTISGIAAYNKLVTAVAAGY